MILTGLTKEDFLDWCETQSHYTDNSNHTITYENSSRGEFLWYGSETNLLKEQRFLNALIIEWFDLLGLWKTTYNNFYVKYFRSELTLIESQNLAITKANEIYNAYN